jgi:hypothetical protein
MGFKSTMRKMAVYLGLVEDEPARPDGPDVDELRRHLGVHRDGSPCTIPGSGCQTRGCPVVDLDPRIEQQVDKAMLHGLSDDERITLKVQRGSVVSWTDNFGNHDTTRIDADAIEVTSFVRHRLAMRGVRR